MVKIGPKVTHTVPDDNNSPKTTTKASSIKGRAIKQLDSKENHLSTNITGKISKTTTTARNLKESDIEIRNK